MSSLAKLQIEAYYSRHYTGKAKATFTAQVNPKEFSVGYTVNWDATVGAGNPNAALKYTGSAPRTMKFELLFDGTGVVDEPADNGAKVGIAGQLAAFEKVAYTYNGTIHQPNFLKICWGSTLLPCRLTSMTLRYTLFAATGEPLRARADVSFQEYVSPETIQKMANRQSPDVTHVVRVKAGDTLPRLAYDVYGDTRYYMDVARFNRLINFRDLAPGQELLFPPLVG